MGDLPFKVREETVSLMSSASNSIEVVVFEKKKFRVSRRKTTTTKKNRVSPQTVNQPNFVLAISEYFTLFQDACMHVRY